MQKLCYFARVFYAQSDKRENTDGGVKPAAVSQKDTFLGFKQRIESFHETRKKMQKRRIEISKQLIQLFIFKF